MTDFQLLLSGIQLPISPPWGKRTTSNPQLVQLTAQVRCEIHTPDCYYGRKQF